MSDAPTQRIAFLLSGSGSTLVNLLAEMEAGRVPGEIALVLSDRSGVKGLEIAEAHGIPTALVLRKDHRGREAYGRALDAVLAPLAPDLVVLGGFLTLYDIPACIEGKIVNVHPALLPAFGGKGCWGGHVHRMVLERGCRVSGCTVHYVTGEVDGGPIIDQLAVRVEENDTIDTLAVRVQAAERELFPRCIADILEGRVRLAGDRVRREARHG